MIRAGNHLDYATKSVDNTAQNDGPFSTNEVGKVTGNQGAKEGSARQDRDDQRSVGFRDSCLADTLDSLDEDLGAQDTVDVTGVITKEDTTERSESTEKIGLPGNGSLDMLNVRGRVEGDGGFLVIARRLQIVRHCCRCAPKKEAGSELSLVY